MALLPRFDLHVPIAQERLSDRERERHAFGRARLVGLDNRNDLLGERERVHLVSIRCISTRGSATPATWTRTPRWHGPIPPSGWYIVTKYHDEDGAEPEEHHFCSDRCQSLGPMPPDVRASRRREMEEEERVAAEAQRSGTGAGHV
jgi:hypothetical protein